MSTLHTIALWIGYAWLACLTFAALGFAVAWMLAPWRRGRSECRGCSRCGEPFFAHGPSEWECTPCRDAEAASGSETLNGRQVIPVYLESQAASVVIRTV